MKAKNYLLISVFIFLGCKDSPRKINTHKNSKIETTVKNEKELNNNKNDKFINIQKKEKSNVKIDKRLIVEFEGKKYIKRNINDGSFQYCPEDKPSKVILYDVIRKEYYDVRTGKVYIISEQGRPCKGINSNKPIDKRLLVIIDGKIYKKKNINDVPYAYPKEYIDDKEIIAKYIYWIRPNEQYDIRTGEFIPMSDGPVFHNYARPKSKIKNEIINRDTIKSVD